LRLKLTVKQAVFKDNERLDLVIDLDWEAIQVYIPNLTGLKIWRARFSSTMRFEPRSRPEPPPRGQSNLKTFKYLIA